MSPAREAVEQLAFNFPAPRRRARRQQRAECYELRRLAYLASRGRGEGEEADALRAKIGYMRKDGAIPRRMEVV